ncbi:MAG: hypothetical protein D3923_15145, partial [Candidatus Electrothrix sp. AR3]|nr:hypothetical protein [Candidatus Electrothrix sp. AR3]
MLSRKKEYVRVLLIGWIAIFLTSCADTGSILRDELERKEITPGIPYYFITIHNEPFNHEQGISKIKESYPILQQMVDKADTYHLKLTIMLAASWTDYILASPKKKAELASWQANGHEIAAHHHSIYHPGVWDGYSIFSPVKAKQIRRNRDHEPETYLGTMHNFIAKLQRINPALKSGCLNDEQNKNVLPDEILYDTCSGFANYGEGGQRQNDFDPEKGKNAYLTVGTYKGIERKWLKIILP